MGISPNPVFTRLCGPERLVSPSDTGTSVYGSLQTIDSSRVHLKVLDSATLARRLRWKMVQQAKKDSAFRAEALQQVPVYAQPLVSPVDISTLPAPQSVQSGWIAGEKVQEMPGALKGQEMPAGYADWFIAVWLGSLVILLWARKAFSRYFSRLLQAFSDFILSMSLFKDRNVLLQRVSFMLQLNFIVVSGLFLYLFLPVVSPSFALNHARLVLLSWGIPAGLILFRLLVNKGLGFLFSREKVFSEYNFHVQLNFKILGIILLPLVIFILYLKIISTNTLILTGIALILILYLHRIYKGYKIIVLNRVSLFYTILYLCTFEILPLILVYKLYGSNAG